jgi:hypothetical protein
MFEGTQSETPTTPTITTDYNRGRRSHEQGAWGLLNVRVGWPVAARGEPGREREKKVEEKVGVRVFVVTTF